MAYRDNVSTLAALRSIRNDPELEEKDLGIGGLHFYNDRSMLTRIMGSKKNKGARLFFQHHAERLGKDKRWVFSGKAFQSLLALAPDYFAELWEDTSERPLLDTFKHADAVVLFWKSNPDWVFDFNRGCDEKMVPDFEE